MKTGTPLKSLMTVHKIPGARQEQMDTTLFQHKDAELELFESTVRVTPRKGKRAGHRMIVPLTNVAFYIVRTQAEINAEVEALEKVAQEVKAALAPPPPPPPTDDTIRPSAKDLLELKRTKLQASRDPVIGSLLNAPSADELFEE